MLSDEQQQFIEAGRTGKYGRLLMLNGPAGTGKTFTINAFCEQIPNVLLAAPTARAASLIRGSTIHRLFGIPRGVCNPNFEDYPLHRQRRPYIETRFFGKKRREPLRVASWILIDEYSMVRCDHIDWISRALTEATGNPEIFGGKRVAFVGDPAQLPPVATGEDLADLEEYGYEYPFDITQAKVWEEMQAA